ncbi:MAG: hypothetical protein K0B81_06940 [Candidatus Cloacimonetes bacterium]|nr:hypothetical protein [Candidatus Cloacimonadota bacterium]
MSVEKYLENIETPEIDPGPFSVRLKYNLKNYLYERRRKRETFLKLTSNVGIFLFIMTSIMIYKPDLAASLHDNLLCKTGIISTGQIDEEQLMAERRQAEIDLPEEGTYLGWRYYTSSSMNSSSPYQIMELSDLPEETPYVIRKVRDRNNRYVYIVSEMEANQNSRHSLY